MYKLFVRTREKKKTRSGFNEIPSRLRGRSEALFNYTPYYDINYDKCATNEPALRATRENGSREWKFHENTGSSG